MKRTLEEKLKYVKLHVDKHVPLHEVHKKYGIELSMLKYLCSLYKEHGDAPFIKNGERRKYSRELKLKAIEDVFCNGMSHRQVAIHIGLSDPKIVDDWIIKYRKEGEEGIKDTYSREAYLKHDESVLKKEYKKLIEDLERTKAENEYLKKSFPHILKRSKQSRKKP